MIQPKTDKQKYKKYKRKYQRLQRQMGEISLAIRDPWLRYIETGQKTVEGRPGWPNKFSAWVGKKVIFLNSKRKITVFVKAIHHYANLYDYLDTEGFDKVLPGVKSKQDAIDIYHQFYSRSEANLIL